MKKKKSDFVIILIVLIVIGINTISLSKYDYVAECNVSAEIAKAILVVENDEIIKKQIDQNSFPIEYNFTVNNYKDDAINNVDFSYQIEVQASVDDFPIDYVLIDCQDNSEIKLSEGKSEIIKLTKNAKESKKFKLYLQWREIDKSISEKVQINLKIIGVQDKEAKNEN